MINCKDFYEALENNGIDFFAGVPDSLLKYICAYISDKAKNHIITANEGNAIALAAGHHLATGNLGLVYLQNSGVGNIVNPLLSLVEKRVYSIPMILLIGWRGEPGKKDAVQHITQGEVTPKLLENLEITYEILSDDAKKATEQINKIINSAKKNNSPCALLVRKGTFDTYKLQKEIKDKYEMTREESIRLVIENLEEDDLIVSTTGKTSRELFESREKLRQKHDNDFLNVGAMGHCSSIALGVALGTDKQVYCFDGDGSVIMHMGALAVLGSQAPKNFKHIIFNNGAHDSVGGQPTVGFNIDFTKIAEACGYKYALKADSREDLIKKVKLLKSKDGSGLLEIRIKKGAREDLKRPTSTPQERKKDFMESIR